MKKILLGLLFISSLLSAQNEQGAKLITVIGYAECEVEPDIITISMKAKENESSTKESDIVKMENRISDLLTSLGIDKSKFSFDRYSANTQFSISSNSKFKLSKSYKLVIDRASLLDTIVAKCFEYGMDNIFVANLEHSKMDSIQNDLLAKATLMAGDKARIMANSSGATLGNVYSINESYKLVGDRQNMFYNRDMQLEDVVVIGYGSTKNARVGSTISLQKLQISKTVIVKYELK